MSISHCQAPKIKGEDAEYSSARWPAPGIQEFKKHIQAPYDYCIYIYIHTYICMPIG